MSALLCIHTMTSVVNCVASHATVLLHTFPHVMSALSTCYLLCSSAQRVPGCSLPSAFRFPCIPSSPPSFVHLFTHTAWQTATCLTWGDQHILPHTAPCRNCDVHRWRELPWNLWWERDKAHERAICACMQVPQAPSHPRWGNPKSCATCAMLQPIGRCTAGTTMPKFSDISRVILRNIQAVQGHSLSIVSISKCQTSCCLPRVASMCTCSYNEQHWWMSNCLAGCKSPQEGGLCSNCCGTSSIVLPVLPSVWWKKESGMSQLILTSLGPWLCMSACAATNSVEVGSWELLQLFLWPRLHLDGKNWQAWGHIYNFYVSILSNFWAASLISLYACQTGTYHHFTTLYST